jgi:hypothetical protein
MDNPIKRKTFFIPVGFVTEKNMGADNYDHEPPIGKVKEGMNELLNRSIEKGWMIDSVTPILGAVTRSGDYSFTYTHTLMVVATKMSQDNSE